MIVCSTPQGFRHVTQADHARFAADLLGLFRLPELVAHARRQRLLRAIAEHDNGWWEADAAPRLDPGGEAALDFRRFPDGLRQEIWQRGVERFAADDPYVAALLAGHALRLSRAREKEESWADFRAALGARREELAVLAGAAREAGEAAEALAAEDRWLALADGLSLAVCGDDAGLLDLPGWRLALRLPSGRSGQEESVDVALEPFPYAGATAFELACRWLPAARYPSAAALGVALATAPWRRLRVRLTPF